MAAREYLWIIKESAYGTQKASPVAGTDSIYIRLDGSNGFTMRPKPVKLDVMYGNGFATPAFTVSDHMECKGSLKTQLCASQSQMLMDWAATTINTGQTVPWTTTEPAGDLASCTVYHGIARVDGTFKRRKYVGVKVASWKLEVGRDGTIAGVSFDLIAQKPVGNAYDATTDPDATAFPAPGACVLPTDPFLFAHTKGHLSSGGSTVAAYSSLSVSATNKVDAQFYEDHFISYARFLGRSSQMVAKLAYKASPDQRALYEALTAGALSVEFDNGTNQLTIDFNGRNVRDSVEDDLQTEKLYDQTVTLQNYWDCSVPGDITITYA